eukprot:1952917-Rhodomonas_salina.1
MWLGLRLAHRITCRSHQRAHTTAPSVLALLSSSAKDSTVPRATRGQSTEHRAQSTEHRRDLIKMADRGDVLLFGEERDPDLLYALRHARARRLEHRRRSVEDAWLLPRSAQQRRLSVKRHKRVFVPPHPVQALADPVVNFLEVGTLLARERHLQLQPRPEHPQRDFPLSPVQEHCRDAPVRVSDLAAATQSTTRGHGQEAEGTTGKKAGRGAYAVSSSLKKRSAASSALVYMASLSSSFRMSDSPWRYKMSPRSMCASTNERRRASTGDIADSLSWCNHSALLSLP